LPPNLKRYYKSAGLSGAISAVFIWCRFIITYSLTDLRGAAKKPRALLANSMALSFLLLEIILINKDNFFIRTV